jgi:L-seryl-tRNA(Ser) seleniumtransferase
MGHSQAHPKISLGEKVMDPGPKVKPDPRSSIPSVDRVLRAIAARHPSVPRWAAAEATRSLLEELREAAASGAEGEALPGFEAVVEAAARAGGSLATPRPTRVVNATGIVLHTNLGRAPLSAEAAAAVARAATGYCDLELDLESGARGVRTSGIARRLRVLSGAADALVVNNNAAALMLATATLARGREVIVSRGELVEIGGSFRIPEILAAAGARMVEVGTTNRTHLADYERAIGPETALLLKVHRSNFEVRGFVAEVDLPELVDLTERGWPPESHAPSRLRLGADVVCFSADKLLGGPQAGILLGRDARAIEAMRRDPMARALRVDKLTLAALDWTLEAYLEGRALQAVPVLGMLLAPEAHLEERARTLAGRLTAALGDAAQVAIEVDRAAPGGGSLPGFELPTRVVTLRVRGGAARCAERLRSGAPPVLARVREGAVVIDVRTLLPGDEKALEDALHEAIR